MLAATALILFSVAATPEALASPQTVDPDAAYARAVQHRLAGRNPEAVAGFQQVLAARPGDVDARLNLGLALLAEGRLDEAETALDAVLLAAPDYADAHVGLARVSQRRGDLAAARAHLARAADLRPDDPDVVALRAQLETPAEPRWRIDAGVARSSLSNGLPDWTEAALSIGREVGDGRVVSFSAQYAERFDLSDLYFEGRLDQRLTNGGAYIALGATPDADFRPEVALAVGGEALVAPHVTATLDAGVARYLAGTVTSLHPGVRIRLFDERLSLSGRWINVRDEAGEHRSGYGLGALWYAAPRLRLRASWADAPESSEGVTVDVRAVSLGVDYDLAERLVLRLSATHEERTAFDRDEVALGLGWRR